MVDGAAAGASGTDDASAAPYALASASRTLALCSNPLRRSDPHPRADSHGGEQSGFDDNNFLKKIRGERSVDAQSDGMPGAGEKAPWASEVKNSQGVLTRGGNPVLASPRPPRPPTLAPSRPFQSCSSTA